MSGRMPDHTSATGRALARGASFEVTLADRVRRSERRAWIVAACALVMSLLMAAGYAMVLPLKERVPYLVMADPYTGTATVARLAGDFQGRDVTTEEAINKSNVAQFVLARESYDSGLIGQGNWRTTLSMADAAVAPAYIALHSESNPERPFRTYGTSRSVRVRILSIVLIGGKDGRQRGATVRFQRGIHDKARGRTEPLDSRIATLEYTYRPDLRLSEEDRLLNPLGFRVIHYRVDQDFAAAPLPEREFAAPPGSTEATSTAHSPVADPGQARSQPSEGPGTTTTTSPTESAQ